MSNETSTATASTDVTTLTKGKDWARGCKLCRYGIAVWPRVEPLAIPSYVVYAHYWRFGVMVLCECRAGQAAEKYLRKIWARIDTGDEMVPSSWSNAIHVQIRSSQEAPNTHKGSRRPERG